jgi:acetyltransferase-like isoleucine patch superfamily enzyme
MKAYRISTGRTITPFKDSVGDVRILDVPLREVQEEALKSAQYDLVDTPPKDEPFLLISDRVWCSVPLLERIREIRGRIRITDPRWISSTHSLQELSDGAYDLAILDGGMEPTFVGVPLHDFDAEIRNGDPLDLHPAIQHAARDVCLTPFSIHHIDHWSHIPRVNQLAILAQMELTRHRWKQSGLIGRLGMILGFLWKVRSFSRRTILRRIGSIGKNCTIHPTAVIEACTIGDNVEIGPNAVVRASVIGDGAKIDESTVVNLSVVGKEARVGRTAVFNLSILYPKAMFSNGDGMQGSVFGTSSFLAIGVVGLDISFGKEIQVEKEGEWVSSGMHFLGIAVGHRAILGNGVRLNYGVSVPNDAMLLGPRDDLYLDASQAPAGAPAILKNGRATPIKKGLPSESNPSR